MTRLRIEADGGSRGNPGPAGYGAVVFDADTGEVLAERAAGIGRATNNVAEYGGLIAGLTAALEIGGVTEVEVAMDSKLVVEQMSGRWQVKHPDMKPLARQAAELVRRLPPVRFGWIPRASNSHADRLANEAMDEQAAGREWAETAPASAAAGGVPAGAGAAPEPGASRPGWRPPAGPPTSTLLLRHGQTPLSIERRFSGIGDPELTPVGEAQAAAAAQRLRGMRERGLDVAAVVTSPLRRARQTADAAAAALGVPPVVEDRLRENDFGDWEGMSFGEVRERWPTEMADWLASSEQAPPGGESFAATARRVSAARDDIVARYGAVTVLLVSHVTPIKSLVREALGSGPETLLRLHLDLAALSVVDWHADGAAVVRSWNDTAHLEGLSR